MMATALLNGMLYSGIAIIVFVGAVMMVMGNPYMTGRTVAISGGVHFN